MCRCADVPLCRCASNSIGDWAEVVAARVALFSCCRCYWLLIV